MKYYSEKLNTIFDSIDELKNAELAAAVKEAEAEEARKREEAEAEEIKAKTEEAKRIMEETKEKYIKARETYFTLLTDSVNKGNFGYNSWFIRSFPFFFELK